MNGFHHVSITGECLQGERSIGLQQVTNIDLWHIEIEERLLGQVIFHIAPDPLNRVQLRTVGRQPHGPHPVGPPKALGDVGATVIQAQAVRTLGKRPGERIDEALEGLGIQIGQFQKEALTRGGRHRAIDIDPFEDMLDCPHGEGCCEW
jgi:hypothetical protein